MTNRKKPKSLLTLALLNLIFSISCQKKIAKIYDSNQSSTSMANLASLDRFYAKAGDEIILNGTNLTPDINVKIKQNIVSLTLIDATSAKLVLPAQLDPGINQLTFRWQGKTLGRLPLVNAQVFRIYTNNPAERIRHL